MQSIRNNAGLKIILALILSISLITTGCASPWLTTAIADLPVLTQMALNIATLVTTLQSGQQTNSTDVAAIQNISSQASRDLNLLQSFYTAYKANPTADAISNIQRTITTITQTLPQLLQAAHVSDPVLSARVTAGVNLILTTVSSFAALMPHAGHATAQTLKFTIPRPKDLKKQWNQEVCSPAPTFTAAPGACVVR